MNLDEIKDFEIIMELCEKNYPEEEWWNKYMEIVEYHNQRANFYWPTTKVKNDSNQHSPVQTWKLAFADTQKYVKEMLNENTN